MTKFELKPWNRGITDADLLADLKRVAEKVGKSTLTYHEYDKHGRCRARTVEVRFGSWNEALKKAGLQVLRVVGITDAELFGNIEQIWIKLGRQPSSTEMIRPLSKYGRDTYSKRFGSWRNALEKFIEFINSDTKSNISVSEANMDRTIKSSLKGKRQINDRLRIQVLIRDGNICKICGTKVTGNDIHIDHIKPWSKGGKTVVENLQVLCSKCNLGKGDWETV